MKKVSTSLGILMFTGSLFGQITLSNPEGGVVSFQTKNKDFSQIEANGSPYLDEEFKFGQILFNDKVKYSGELRYNAFNSEIEIEQADGKYSAALKRNQISAVIGDKTYRLFVYAINDAQKKTGYFNPLNEGKVQLLFKPEIKLRKGRIPNTSYGRLVPPTYIDVSSYYLKIDNQAAYKIYLRKKYFYQALGKKEIQHIVETKNLKLNKLNDILLLLEAYNSKTDASK